MADEIVDIDKLEKQEDNSSKLDIQRMLKNQDSIEEKDIEKLESEEKPVASEETEEETEETEESNEEATEEETEEESEEAVGSEEESEEEDTSTLGQFYKALGEPEGLDLQNYDNTLEGVSKMVKDVAARETEGLAQQFLSERFREDPLLEQFYAHRAEGKSLETFMSKNVTTNFDKLDLSTERGQKDMLSLYYKDVNNLSDKAIDALVSASENEGTLEEDAANLKTEYSNLKKDEVAKQEQQEQEEYSNRKAENDKLIIEAKSIIRSGKLGDLKLTASQINEFEAQALGTTSEGASIVNDTYNKLTMSNKLKADFIIMNINKLDSVFKLNKKKSSNTNLDKMFEENKSRSSIKPSLNKGKGSKGANLSKIDFNKIIVEN